MFSSCLHVSVFQANLSTVIPTGLELHFLKIEMFSGRSGQRATALEWIQPGSPVAAAQGPKCLDQQDTPSLGCLAVALVRKMEKKVTEAVGNAGVTYLLRICLIVLRVSLHPVGSALNVSSHK